MEGKLRGERQSCSCIRAIYSLEGLWIWVGGKQARNSLVENWRSCPYKLGTTFFRARPWTAVSAVDAVFEGV